MREWPQGLLAKGVVWMKIDPHYMSSAFCAAQERVKGNISLGCFVLSHDTPSAEHTSYNTTDDVLAFIEGNALFFRYFHGIGLEVVLTCELCLNAVLLCIYRS